MLQLTRWYLLNVYILYVRKCTFAHIQCWREFAKCRFAHFPSIFSAHVDTYYCYQTLLFDIYLLLVVYPGSDVNCVSVSFERRLCCDETGRDYIGKTW